ncbi:MAG: amidase family protein, partial [Bacteroidales bacterium]
MKTTIFKKKSQKIAVIFLAAIFSFLLSCETKHERTSSQENNDFKFLEADIAQLRQGYEDGSFSITEVIQAYIERIDNIDKNGPSLNSIITVNPDALTIAAKLDEELQKGITRGPLHGIPVVLKDNIDTHDKMPTTAGSLALANSYPLQDSHVAKKLRKA